MPIPCLFTLGSVFGNRVLFGLLSSEGIHPVRVVASDKVRTLHAPKPAPVPPNLDLLLAGRECEEFLEEQGMLEALFHSMAEEMVKAIRTRTPGLKRKYEKQQALDKQYWYLKPRVT